MIVFANKAEIDENNMPFRNDCNDAKPDVIQNDLI